MSFAGLQAVGRLSRKRGTEDIDKHFLKATLFAVDPVYSIPEGGRPRISSTDPISATRSVPGEWQLGETRTNGLVSADETIEWLLKVELRVASPRLPVTVACGEWREAASGNSG